MKTAIIYSSKHGATEKIAQYIASELKPLPTELINIKVVKNIDLSNYDRVIMGSSVYAGRINHKLSVLIKNNLLTLLEKKIALFICGMNTAELESEFKLAYPELLRQHSTCNLIVEGEYNFNKMNIIERLLVRKISGVNHNLSKTDFHKIDLFIQTLNFKLS